MVRTLKPPRVQGRPFLTLSLHTSESLSTQCSDLPLLGSHAALELGASPSVVKISLSCFSRNQFFTASDRVTTYQQ